MFSKKDLEEANKWLEEHADEIPPVEEPLIDNETVFSYEELVERMEKAAEAEENDD